ncbi:MAG: tagatose 1,6-diphosphate aldolase [Chloroflexota bacterium]
MTTIGKYRHFSRVADINGHFIVMAIDHRGNLFGRLNQHASHPLTDDDFVTFKQSVTRALMPHTSAILADPKYAIVGSIANHVISGDKGLIAPIEITDYDTHPSQRSMTRIPNWSVKKIKMMGGDGVKSLLPYNPQAENHAETIDFVQYLINECTTYDIPLFLEPIPYALDPSATLSNADLLQMSVEMCQTFSQMGVDSLKLPFPVNHKLSQDMSQWQDACEAITEACDVPWALLSAGVDFDTFLKQTEIACQAGASGVIVGRAIWTEAIALQGDDRTQFFETTATERMRQLAEVCTQNAKAWHESVQTPNQAINWYEHYQSDEETS